MMYSQNRTQKDLGSTWIIALFRNRQCLHLFAESYYNIVCTISQNKHILITN